MGGGVSLREGFSKTTGLRVVLMWLLVYKAIYEQQLILSLRVEEIQLQLLQEKLENINDLIRSCSRLTTEHLTRHPCLIAAAQ